MACIYSVTSHDNTRATVGQKKLEGTDELSIHNDIEVEKYLERFPLLEDETIVPQTNEGLTPRTQPQAIPICRVCFPREFHAHPFPFGGEHLLCPHETWQIREFANVGMIM